jgi:hypothetical protein
VLAGHAWFRQGKVRHHTLHSAREVNRLAAPDELEPTEQCDSVVDRRTAPRVDGDRSD